MTALPTHYRSQSGKVTPIAKMVDEHLVNAVAKLRRGGSAGAFSPSVSPTLMALEAEKTKRGLNGAR